MSHPAGANVSIVGFILEPEEILKKPALHFGQVVVTRDSTLGLGLAADATLLGWPQEIRSAVLYGVNIGSFR